MRSSCGWSLSPSTRDSKRDARGHLPPDLERRGAAPRWFRANVLDDDCVRAPSAGRAKVRDPFSLKCSHGIF